METVCTWFKRNEQIKDINGNNNLTVTQPINNVRWALAVEYLP